GPARVFIVDDHPIVREGLALRIARQVDLVVCGQAEDVPTALRLAASTTPDVAVIDIALKDGNGLDLVRRLKARGDDIRMLVWSTHNEAHYAERAPRAGALGFIAKDQATDKIIHAIHRVLEGKIYLNDDLAERLLHKSMGMGMGMGM